MPDELNLRLGVAEEDLVSKRVIFRVVGHDAFDIEDRTDWTVCAMRPPPGSTVKRGTTVNLIIVPLTRPRCKAFRHLRLH